MSHLQRISVCTAAFSALSGTGLIAIFLSSQNVQASVLMAAAAAAAIGVASLLLSVLAIYLVTTRRFETNLPRPGSPGARWVEDGTGAAALHQRREVLDGRLHVDEPYICSQHMVPCTCWSFCGRLPDQDFIRPTRAQCELSKPGGKPLPVVHRSGRDDCPFRYASPAFSPAPDNATRRLRLAAVSNVPCGRSLRQSTRAGD